MMTIDTSFKTMTACQIQPVKAKFTDAANSTHLGVRITFDDLNGCCTLYWALMDSNGMVYDHGNQTISGADYLSWGGDNLYPFTYIGNLFNLIFI